MRQLAKQLTGAEAKLLLLKGTASKHHHVNSWVIMAPIAKPVSKVQSFSRTDPTNQTLYLGR